MKKLEYRIKRLEAAMCKEGEPVTFKLIFFGEALMPKEPHTCGNVTFEPVLYDDLQPVAYMSSEQ